MLVIHIQVVNFIINVVHFVDKLLVISSSPHSNSYINSAHVMNICLLLVKGYTASRMETLKAPWFFKIISRSLKIFLFAISINSTIVTDVKHVYIVTIHTVCIHPLLHAL